MKNNSIISKQKSPKKQHKVYPLKRGIPFHLTKLLFPVPLFCICLQDNNQTRSLLKGFKKRMVYICSVFLPALLEIIEHLTKQTRNFNFRVRIGKFSLFSNINRETIWELLSSLVNEGLCFSGEEIKNFINSSVNENEYSNRYLRLQDTSNVKC